MSEIIPPEKVNEKPKLLKVISILSFVSIGNGIITTFMSLFKGPLTADQINKVQEVGMKQVDQIYEMGEPGAAEMMLKIINLVRYTNDNFYTSNTINLLSYIIGLLGVVYMLMGRKIGFHMYIIYSIIAVFAIYASAPVQEIPTAYFTVLGTISLLFIFMYSRCLKWMK